MTTTCDPCRLSESCWPRAVPGRPLPRPAAGLSSRALSGESLAERGSAMPWWWPGARPGGRWGTHKRDGEDSSERVGVQQEDQACEDQRPFGNCLELDKRPDHDEDGQDEPLGQAGRHVLAATTGSCRALLRPLPQRCHNRQAWARVYPGSGESPAGRPDCAYVRTSPRKSRWTCRWTCRWHGRWTCPHVVGPIVQ